MEAAVWPLHWNQIEEDKCTKTINSTYLEPGFRHESLESRFASADDQRSSQIWGTQLYDGEELDVKEHVTLKTHGSFKHEFKAKEPYKKDITYKILSSNPPTKMCLPLRMV